MRIAVLAVTAQGKQVGKKISSALKEHDVAFFLVDKRLGEFVGRIFRKYDALVFIMALGIVVRAVSKHIKSKKTDPAVVALDEKENFAISVVSGHRGANNLARLIARRIGAAPVVTTASELGRSLCVGIGARKNIDRESIIGAISSAFDKAGLNLENIKAVATLDSRAKESGVRDAAKELGVPLQGIEKSRIKEVECNFERSEYVKEKIGVGCVAEPCAVLACAGRYKLIQKKIKFRGVTVAIAEELGLGTRSFAKQGRESLRSKTVSLTHYLRYAPASLSRSNERQSAERGKIYLVGMGPGSAEHTTPSARSAIESAEVVIGYTTYLRQIKNLTRGKKIIESGMGDEVERARQAVDIAQNGKRVAVVSSGDPGIYAMASVVFEHLSVASAKDLRSCLRNNKRKIKVDVEVIPGITAASAASALLGSPLGNDFAVVSLSDLLTPWEVIERRLEHAAKGDFVVVIYNPKSKGREQQIKKAAEILLKYRKPSTPVGVVRNAMKDGQSVKITTLGKMLGCKIDMVSTVIIGNSETFIYDKKIVTPRGYARKYYDMGAFRHF